MFGFIKKQLHKIYDSISSKTALLFGRSIIDESTLKELEKILIESDTGVKTTRTLIEILRSDVKSGKIKEGHDLKQALEHQLIAILQTKKYIYDSDIILLVGINGSGKTTFAGKLGYYFTQEKQSVLFAAGDTFRAAATQQLAIWAQKSNSPIIIGSENQDPSAVIYKACQEYISNRYNKLIIDTAGRLQTKINLMKELEKIKRTIQKLLPDKKISTLLTIDSMLGQNSLVQAKIFNESTHLDGLILTKMDGTSKGGIIFAIAQELNIPVAYISYGEKLDQFSSFDPESFVKELLQD